MAAQGFLDRVLGKTKRIIASVTGTADAIPAGDATGRLDISWMPVGVGAEVIICASFEDLTAGNFINLFLSGGVIKARKADATTAGKPAHGFVLANVTAPANATVYGLSNTNTALSGLTIGTDYYLSTTPGATTATAPTGAGNLSQYLGIASLTTEIVFTGSPASAVEMA